MSDEDVRILLNDDKVIQLIDSGLLTPPGTRVAKKGKKEFEWVDGGKLRDHFANDKDLANYIQNVKEEYEEEYFKVMEEYAADF